MNLSLAEQLQDVAANYHAEKVFLGSESTEHMCAWDEIGLTVQDEPFDLASEIEPSVWDKYMPNDGTSRVEHRLRKQGLRKAEDSQREVVQELVIELMVQRRTIRVRILRQASGDVVLN